MSVSSMSVNDACRSVGIGRTKMYELISNGEIATFKIGRRTLIPVFSISAFIERKVEVGSTAA